MLLGAASFGLLTAVLIEFMERTRRVQQDAAIGITFTALFALGVVMIALLAGNVDLDQECVLYGEIAYVPLYPPVVVGGLELAPPAVVMLAVVFLAVVAFIALFWKELLISSFDPALAAAMGINATLLHYMLMGMTSLTIVGAFDAVGAILVVAMLIAPGATAYLMTDRMAPMLAWSLVVSAVSAVGGKLLAAATETSIAGSMAAVAGLCFTAAFLFSPRHGVLARAVARWALRLRVARENLVAELRRADERARPAPSYRRLAEKLGWSRSFRWLMLHHARGRGLVEGTSEGIVLLPLGRELAERVRTAHKRWQEELERLGYDREHAHASAHRLEHVVLPGALDGAPGRVGGGRAEV
jgi:manganese/zinc/iron transport system permease protein